MTNIELPDSNTLFKLDQLVDAWRAYEGSSASAKLGALLETELFRELHDVGVSSFEKTRAVISYLERAPYASVARAIESVLESAG